MLEETIILIGLAGLNIILVAVNTYWAWRRTCYNRDVYQGSKQYWDSWKLRSKDVAKSILKDIETPDLEKELKKRYGKAKKKKKSRILRKRNRGTQEATTGKTSSNQSNGHTA